MAKLVECIPNFSCSKEKDEAMCIPLCVLLRLRSYKWNCLRVSLNYSG